MAQSTKDILGGDAEGLLTHVCKTIPKDQLHLPGPDFVDRIFAPSDRSNRVLGNLQWIFQHGRLAGTGYVSILPVDQGIEHTAGASFAPNPIYFDPENIVKLGIEGGCNAVASTLGVLGAVARRYAHKIPFVVKFNHNELLTYPTKYDQRLFATVEQAYDMGAAAVRPSTSAPRSPAGRSKRSPRPSRARTNSASPPSSGATCATTPSRRGRRITTSPPTPRRKPTTSA